MDHPIEPLDPDFHLFRGSRKVILMRAALIILTVAALDWRFDANLSFAFLYLLPMLMVGTHLSRPQIAFIAALCTGLGEAFDAFPWSPAVGVPRLILTFAAFFGAGVYSFESMRNRRLVNRHIEQLEREAELQNVADEQLRFLIDSSPATILTLDADRRVLLANVAAHRLLGVDPKLLEGQSIAKFFPALARVPLSWDVPQFRTTMECRGQRQDGEVFLAQVLFSTYRTGSGPRLAAVVLDESEAFRDREEYGLQHLLAGSKIVVSAVCHEMRNICGAIAAVHANLARDERLSINEDFCAFGSLIEGLGRMAAFELPQAKRSQTERADVLAVLEQLRILIEPAFRDAGIALRWELPDHAPSVWAEHQSLLQVCLNIVKNSQRALERADRKELVVRVDCFSADAVVVRFFDSGAGVAEPERLFKPFQPGAEATGLGLYLSRAFMRAFHGDLQYEPQPSGCCFAIVLSCALPGVGGSVET